MPVDAALAAKTPPGQLQLPPSKPGARAARPGGGDGCRVDSMLNFDWFSASRLGGPLQSGSCRGRAQGAEFSPETGSAAGVSTTGPTDELARVNMGRCTWREGGDGRRKRLT